MTHYSIEQDAPAWMIFSFPFNVYINGGFYNCYPTRWMAEWGIRNHKHSVGVYPKILHQEEVDDSS